MNKSHLSLFTGIGGLDLAAEWAGFQTVGQCEWADYPTKVLEKYWPDVPRWRDIRMLTKESFYERTGLRTVDLISGGFPCQPFSVAGKRRGSEDDRYLWPEMLKVIKELRPRWVIGENVAGIVNMALDTVLSDLEGIGYTAQAFIIPACAVDSPHRRNRCAIMAYSDNRSGIVRWEWELSAVKSPGSSGKNHGRRTPEHGAWERRAAQPGLGGMADGLPRWMDEPLDVPRIVQGVKDRVGRLKCLGNAVVPQQFYPIFRAIAEIETRRNMV
ncbi:DNA (cytosine-5-)-methyltransferase [Oscillospiraceae bacterium 42-9]